jgi:hypothetical protein
VLFTKADLARCRRIFAALGRLQPGSPLRAASALWTGLRAEDEVRYLLVWVALEALFGPKDGHEVTHRVAERIALFLSPRLGARRELYAQAKQDHGLRSAVVHGRGLARRHRAQPGVNEENSERFIRASLLKILSDPGMTSTFSSEAKREDYLDGLVLGR